MQTSPAYAHGALGFSGKQRHCPFAHSRRFEFQQKHRRLKNKWEGNQALPHDDIKFLLGNVVRRRRRRFRRRYFRQLRIAPDAGRRGLAIAVFRHGRTIAILDFQR